MTITKPYIIDQLIKLRFGPELDEHGRLRPTKYAYDTTLSLLGCDIPPCCVSTDSTGGVRVEWVRESVSVHLIVPADSQQLPYIYHKVGSAYATVNATPEGLDKWLKLVREPAGQTLGE